MRLLTLLAVLAATPAFAQDTPYKPTVGKLHPDFELPNIETSKPVSLKDYRGKKVVLFHFASW